MSVYTWIVWDIIILRCIYHWSYWFVHAIILLYIVIITCHLLSLLWRYCSACSLLPIVGGSDTLLTVQYTLHCWVYAHSSVGYIHTPVLGIYTLQCWVCTHYTVLVYTHSDLARSVLLCTVEMEN